MYVHIYIYTYMSIWGIYREFRPMYVYTVHGRYRGYMGIFRGHKH